MRVITGLGRISFILAAVLGIIGASAKADDRPGRRGIVEGRAETTSMSMEEMEDMEISPSQASLIASLESSYLHSLTMAPAFSSFISALSTNTPALSAFVGAIQGIDVTDTNAEAQLNSAIGGLGADASRFFASITSVEGGIVDSVLMSGVVMGTAIGSGIPTQTGTGTAKTTTPAKTGSTPTMTGTSTSTAAAKNAGPTTGVDFGFMVGGASVLGAACAVALL